MNEEWEGKQSPLVKAWRSFINEHPNVRLMSTMARGGIFGSAFFTGSITGNIQGTLKMIEPPPHLSSAQRCRTKAEAWRAVAKDLTRQLMTNPPQCAVRTRELKTRLQVATRNAAIWQLWQKKKEAKYG